MQRVAYIDPANRKYTCNAVYLSGGFSPPF
jgi:hypothetical protein